MYAIFVKGDEDDQGFKEGSKWGWHDFVGIVDLLEQADSMILKFLERPVGALVSYQIVNLRTLEIVREYPQDMRNI